MPSVIASPDGMARADNDGTHASPATKKEQRRASVERLLSAALRLFITQGYQATSVEQVAHAADLTKGAVDFYFKSKARLLMDLLDRVEDRTIAPTVAAVRGAEGDARDKLVAFMHSQSTIGAEHGALMMLAILMSTEFHGSGDPIEERVAEVLAPLYEVLTDVVEEGRANGTIRTALGTAETVGMIMAINQGCFVEWYRSRDRLDGPAFVRAMRTIVLDGVTAPAGHG
jgi:TetR/AcrR family transcriptional repressor of nem operon